MLIEEIRNEFCSGKLRNDLFPMITKFGVRDYSETVHSIGLNYITAIGRTIEGVAAVSECPVYPYDETHKDLTFVAESSPQYKTNAEPEVRPIFI